VVGGEFVVAICDPATSLNLVEEPFDQIASAVEIRAEADQLITVAPRRNIVRQHRLYDSALKAGQFVAHDSGV
jgi:hypothetical protein